MLDKYIVIHEKLIEVGQYPSTGAWYCKNLPAEKHELKEMIQFVINILNDCNNTQKLKNKNIDTTLRGIKP